MLRHKNHMISAADYHVKRFCEMPWKECILLLKCYGLRQKDSVEVKWIWIPRHFDHRCMQFYDLQNVPVILGEIPQSRRDQERSCVCQRSCSLHNFLLWGRKAMAYRQGQMNECSVSSSAAYSPHAGLRGPLGSPPSPEAGEMVLVQGCSVPSPEAFWGGTGKL